MTIALRATAIAALALFVGCAGAGPAWQAGGEVVDLTHAFDESTVYWPTAEGFRLEVVFKGDHSERLPLRSESFRLCGARRYPPSTRPCTSSMEETPWRRYPSSG